MGGMGGMGGMVDNETMSDETQRITDSRSGSGDGVNPSEVRFEI